MESWAAWTTKDKSGSERKKRAQGEDDCVSAGIKKGQASPRRPSAERDPLRLGGVCQLRMVLRRAMAGKEPNEDYFVTPAKYTKVTFQCL